MYCVIKKNLSLIKGVKEKLVYLECGRKSGCHLYLSPAQLMGNVIIPALYDHTNVLFAFLSLCHSLFPPRVSYFHDLQFTPLLCFRRNPRREKVTLACISFTMTKKRNLIF